MKTYFYAKAITYQNVLDLISRYTLDFPEIETGGDLFGFWTNSGCPVILVVTGPGENARRSAVSFHQDVGYLQTIHSSLNQRHGLQHIGAWHSHHKLDLARPSGYDVSTARAGLGQAGLQRLLVVISNIRDAGTEINAFLFREKEKVAYVPLIWAASGHENPYYQHDSLMELIVPPVTKAKKVHTEPTFYLEDLPGRPSVANPREVELEPTLPVRNLPEEMHEAKPEEANLKPAAPLEDLRPGPPVEADPEATLSVQDLPVEIPEPKPVDGDLELAIPLPDLSADSPDLRSENTDPEQNTSLQNLPE